MKSMEHVLAVLVLLLLLGPSKETNLGADKKELSTYKEVMESCRREEIKKYGPGNAEAQRRRADIWKDTIEQMEQNQAEERKQRLENTEKALKDEIKEALGTNGFKQIRAAFSVDAAQQQVDAAEQQAKEGRRQDEIKAAMIAEQQAQQQAEAELQERRRAEEARRQAEEEEKAAVEERRKEELQARIKAEAELEERRKAEEARIKEEKAAALYRERRKEELQERQQEAAMRERHREELQERRKAALEAALEKRRQEERRQEELQVEARHREELEARHREQLKVEARHREQLKEEELQEAAMTGIIAAMRAGEEEDLVSTNDAVRRDVSETADPGASVTSLSADTDASKDEGTKEGAEKTKQNTAVAVNDRRFSGIHTQSLLNPHWDYATLADSYSPPPNLDFRSTPQKSAEVDVSKDTTAASSMFLHSRNALGAIEASPTLGATGEVSALDAVGEFFAPAPAAVTQVPTPAPVAVAEVPTPAPVAVTDSAAPAKVNRRCPDNHSKKHTKKKGMRTKSSTKRNKRHTDKRSNEKRTRNLSKSKSKKSIKRRTTHKQTARRH